MKKDNIFTLTTFTLIMFFRAKQWTITGALYPLLVLDFLNVIMMDAHVTAMQKSKVPTRSVPTGYIMNLMEPYYTLNKFLKIYLNNFSLSNTFYYCILIFQN